MAATASVAFPGCAKGPGEIAIVSAFSRCPRFVKPCTVAATWTTPASFSPSVMAAPPRSPPTPAAAPSCSPSHLISSVRSESDG
jgi:hypothetical protein